jgi:single-strand DNA-binding protein
VEDSLHRKGLALMSQDNQITLRGYLTAEPKLYQKTATAVPVTEMRVGSTPRRLNRATGEWEDLPTSYYKVKCWRRLAINAASSLHKGDTVVVRGRFYMNNWVDNQQRPRSTLEIEADSLGHDLAYGWSHFLRGSRPSGGRADDGGEMARQDLTPASPDDSDDEYPSDPDNDTLDNDDPDNDASEETVPAPGDGDVPTTGNAVTDGDGSGLESGDVSVPLDRTGDASLTEMGTQRVDSQTEAVSF